MNRYYRDQLSDFKSWNQLKHAEEWLIFPENIGKHLSLDETSLSQDELYTILTNKNAKGKKGAIVAVIAGTSSDTVIKHLSSRSLVSIQSIVIQ